MSGDIEQNVLTDEDRQVLGVDVAEDMPDDSALGKAAENSADHDPNRIPSWAKLPPNFVIPNGKEVVFVRFYGKFTDAPDAGDRWCLIWGLSDLEETNATKLARGDQTRVFKELTKATIRLVDGLRPDWTGKMPPGTYSVSKFWNEIGPKYRSKLLNLYMKTHMLSDEESVDFFTNCVAFRTVRTG